MDLLYIQPHASRQVLWSTNQSSMSKVQAASTPELFVAVQMQSLEQQNPSALSSHFDASISVSCAFSQETYG